MIEKVNTKEIEDREFCYQIVEELARARKKFPKQDVWITLAALTEEVGELNKAILEFTHEKDKGVTLKDIRKEAVQTCVMAMRVILDTY